MKVSIVIPIYNVESYIRECLNSVLKQTLKDIEIILVNDGSTDNSIDNIIDLIEMHSNIILLNQTNQGLSAARNKGLAYATGEYVAFVDSDDLINETFIENLYLEAKKENLDIAFGGYSKIYKNNNIQKISRSSELFNKNEVMDGITYLLNQLKLYDYRMEVWDDLYKRSFLIDNNIKFGEGLLHEDEDFTPNVLLHANRVKLIDSNDYLYRQRENSIMSSGMKINNFKSYIKIIEKYIALFYSVTDTRKRTTISYLLEDLVNKFGAHLVLSNQIKNKELIEVYKKWPLNDIFKYNDRVSYKQIVKYKLIKINPKFLIIFFRRFS